ncbi:choline ethanolamine kinase, partial [Vairimorpha ceranae]
EYCSIGNNLVDIANLFCETEIDYEKNVYIKGSGYTEEDRILFLRKYFNKNDVKCELQKINNLEVVGHFLWFVWCVYIIKSNNNSEFDYKKYSLSRLQYLNNIFTSDELKILLSYLNC